MAASPMMNRWFHRPTLHSPGHGQERKVGWLELFYDLIYVATIVQLGNALAHHVSVAGFLAFAGLFVPIWYTWTGFTFYSNRFVVDDLVHRALVLLQMFAVGAMAVSVPDVLEGAPEGFALSHAVARIVLVLFYARAWRQEPRSRAMTRRFTLGFGIGAALWLASVWAPAPWGYLLWAVAMINDISVGIGKQAREMGARFPPDIPHMSERYGLLTIIVLGEGFVKVLTEVSAQGATPATVGLASATLVITASLWWIYFDDVAGSRIRPKRLAPYFWVYAHLPMTIAVTGVGVAAKKVVFFDPWSVELAKYRWLLCGTLGLAFLSVGIIDAVTERRQSELSDRARVQVRVASAFLILLLAPAGGFMPSWAFVSMVAIACVAQVIFDLSMAPEMGHLSEEELQSGFLAEEEEAEVEEAQGTPRRFDVGAAIRKGTPSELKRDLYFHLMEGSWLRVFVTLGALYLLVNVVFAALYLLEPWGVTELMGGGFLEAFAFSVQTFTTIGYGAMAPDSTWAHVLVIIEAAVGLLFVAVATGLIFAKAARPRSSVLFSKVLVLEPHDGVPTLSFRVGNARGNDIVEASMTVSAVLDVVSPEGHSMRRVFDLELRRQTQPIFALTWQLFHDIDGKSPLYGLDITDPDGRVAAIIASLTGHDATYAQTTHARKLYYPEDIRVDHRFVDVIERLDTGRLLIDYDVFHRTRPLDHLPSSATAPGAEALEAETAE